jgi:hypothetical protein
MDAAYSHGFEDLRFETGCCATRTTLNDLLYEWPAGFARFALEVSGSGVDGFLSERELEALSCALMCAVRQVIARY